MSLYNPYQTSRDADPSRPSLRWEPIVSKAVCRLAILHRCPAKCHIWLYLYLVGLGVVVVVVVVAVVVVVVVAVAAGLGWVDLVWGETVAAVGNCVPVESCHYLWVY